MSHPVSPVQLVVLVNSQVPGRCHHLYVHALDVHLCGGVYVQKSTLADCKLKQVHQRARTDHFQPHKAIHSGGMLANVGLMLNIHSSLLHSLSAQDFMTLELMQSALLALIFLSSFLTWTVEMDNLELG